MTHIEIREDSHNQVEKVPVRTEDGEAEFLQEVRRIARIRFREGPSYMHPDAEWQKVTISLVNGDEEYNRIEIL